MDGSLKEYSEPVKVYEALGLSRLCCFLCSSDELLYDARIPALASQDSLHLGQLYFMLPRSKLDYTLTATDMAGLAVKASSALPAVTPPEKKRSRSQNRAIRVMPIAEVDEGKYHELKKITTSSSSLRTILVGRFSRSSMLGTIDEADE
ncbi:uncharacterized protein [Typha latifolia]|uniref:uncharacterized protein n=1 Tax=Typha latifolia TaxID=4733 RepID=UPI003C2E11A0